jgi:hypothetical protein
MSRLYNKVLAPFCSGSDHDHRYNYLYKNIQGTNQKIIAWRFNGSD